MPAVTVTTRGNKGSALTWNELDANFDDLAAAVSAKDFVSDYGADPTGATNSDAAWTAAVAAGGRIFVPAGEYVFTSNKTVSDKSGLTFEGEGTCAGSAAGVDVGGAAVFRFETTTGDCITFDNCQHSGIERILFTPNVRRTGGWDVKFTGGCYDCFMYDCRHDYGWNGVWVHHASETNLHNPAFRHMYGPEPVLYGRGADATKSCYRCVVVNLQCDNPYTNSVEYAQTATAYSATAFSEGDLIRVNDKFYECIVAGTASGTAPSTIGGTTPVEGFTETVTDGTVEWAFRGHAELSWLTMDSYAYSLIVDKAAVINGWLGFYMRDTVGAASDASIPKFVWLYGFEADHNHLRGMSLNYGQNVYMTSPWVSSALTNCGIVIDSTFIGDVQMGGGRVFGCAQHGILIEAGPINVRLDGLLVTANSQEGSGSYHGITTGVGASGMTIFNCSTQRTDGGTNQQGYGYLAQTGIANSVIAFNNFQGNVTGGATGGTLSETLIYKNNVGTGNLVTGLEWEVLKTSDQTSIGTSFVDIGELSFPIDTANARYAFEFWILADADATTTGIDVSINGPSTPTALTYTVEYWTSASAKAFAGFDAYDGDTASTDSNGTDRRMFKVEGVIANGSNTGTLAARVKGETGTGVNVRSGSWGRIKRLS
jgi:hypothetical protein